MTKFEPVWISSVEHLTTFQSIFRGTSWLGRGLGRYKMPSDFPCIQMPGGLLPGGIFSPRIPIVMFSQGQLDVGERSLGFQSVDWQPPTGKRLNLLNDWHFDLNATEIVSVEKFEQPAPIRYYTMNFTRLRTTRGDLLHDFLLCVGGSGLSMKNIRQNSEELQQKLLALNSQIHTPSGF